MDLEILTLLLLANFKRSNQVLAYLKHPTVPFSFITAGKSSFLEHTRLCWGIDLFFKSNRVPITIKHCPDIFICSSKIRKFINISVQAGKKEQRYKSKSLKQGLFANGHIRIFSDITVLEE